MERVRPLNRFPMITTNRVEEAEFNLSQTLTGLQIKRVDNRRSFQLKMNGFDIGSSSLVYNQFRADTKIEIGMDIDHVLFSAFRNARGYTPMEFLTEQRLKNARKKLHKSHPQASVSDIAMECGFRHLGRFSQFYWKRFGERPSDTLRKGK